MAAAPNALAGYFLLDSTDGNYQWFDDGGHSTPYELTPGQYSELVNQLVASSDEAVGATVPADISTADAQVGAGLWDNLVNAGASVKSAAMDFLGGSGEWPLFDTIGTLGPAAMTAGAIAGAGYIGWQAGSALGELLGITGGGDGLVSAGAVNDSVSGFRAVDAGFDLCDQNYDSLCTGAVGGCGDCDTGQPITEVTAVDGFVVEWNPTGGTYNSYNDNTVPPYPSFTAQPLGSKDGVNVVGAPANGSCVEVQVDVDNESPTHMPLSPTFSVWCPGNVSVLPGPGQGEAYPVVTSVSGTAESPTEAGQKSAVSNCLQEAYPVTPYNGYNTECGVFNDYVCSQAATECFGAPVTETGTVTLPAITTNETYAQWAAAARAAGLLGTVTQSTLPDDEADPTVAPDDMVRTSPAAGTKVDARAAVTAYVNPDSVPQTGGGGPPGAPVPPGISVPGAATPCNVFPFGVPCWIGGQLNSLVSASPVAPDFQISTPSALGGGSMDVNFDNSVFGVNMDSVMSVVRPILLALSLAGLVYWVAGLALGGSTSGGGESDD